MKGIGSFYRSVKVLGLVMASLCLGMSPLQAADGSGNMLVVPDSATANSTGNDFHFTYTASEDMGDGSVSLFAPDPWPDPTANNTAVTVTNGLTGTVINTLDANPPTGWTADFTGPLAPLCGLLGVLCDVDLSTDTNDKQAGTGSLHADVGLANIAVLGSTRIYFNYGAAQNWSGFTHLSFWVKADGLALANVLTQGRIVISEGANLSNGVSYPLSAAILDVSLLQSGQWTQVIVNLTSQASSTRNAVRSYGFVSADLVGVSVTGDIRFDHIMAGPAGPIFSGNTVRQDLIFLDQGGTVEFDYNNITAPGQAGDYEFTASQQVDSSGPMTNLLSGSPIIEVIGGVGSETDCNNNVDDDGDGDTDCDDSDCTGDPDCTGTGPETNCNNNVDDDGDGATDCADADCDSDPVCTNPGPEDDCNNNVDDDGDGAVDCADADCDSDAVCTNPGPESDCADGVDNDGDGAADCADADCASNPACDDSETDCDNDFDEDGDGAVDCADSDCTGDPDCVPETNCVNGADDDGDGDVDCEDTDCADTPACPDTETSCNNEIDDDHDGATDCADGDCTNNPACTDPGGDDDGDGVDNDDDNCVMTPNPNQEDRDGDGLGDVCDNIIDKDADSDGDNEQAVDHNNDQCFGDEYFDPDGSSNDCIRTDGSNDSCEDFFIDTNLDGCADRCPEVFWNPTGDVLSTITERELDVDGDGDTELVCAYDSDGDGEDDSFVEPGDQGGEVGGQGAGLPNPFGLSGGGCGCKVAGAERPSLDGFGFLLIAILSLAGLRFIPVKR